MKRDEVWEELRKDDTRVYGEPIIDAFLKMTEELDDAHWDGLTTAQRGLPNPEIRLKFAATQKEAERAVKDGAESLDTAAMHAARRGHLESCKWMVKQGAGKGWALAGAARGGQLEVCKWLVENGAQNLNTALARAAENGHLELCKWLSGKMPWWHLAPDKALVAAAGAGQLEVCRWVVDNGTTELDNALAAAAEHGHLDVCRLLVDKGAKNLDRALAYAAQNGHLEICRLLLDKGAKDLDRAIKWANDAGTPEAVDFLTQAKRERRTKETN